MQENSGRMEQRRHQSQGNIFHPTSSHSQQQQQRRHEQQHFDDTSMMDHRQNHRRQQQRQQQTEVRFVFQKDNSNMHECLKPKEINHDQNYLYIVSIFIQDGT
jgi:hypothetical protein